jgi:two-component system chemotaxis response regulator CheB
MEKSLLQKDGFLIVAGASAGGMKAIRQLLGSLPRRIDAAICVVLHLSRHVDAGHFLAALQKSTYMPCQVAMDNTLIEKGTLYLAPSNHHLIIRQNILLLGRGPGESRWRPSIDVTFRSAAVSWDTHTIGIILSGMLDDGVAGMEAVKLCGGFSIVQDLQEAEYPDMPQAVLRTVKADRSLSIDAMAAAIAEYMDAPRPRRQPPPDVLKEARLAELVASRIDHMQDTSHAHTVYTCPDCGGGLWEIKEGKLIRYRCHIGHTFTERELITGHGEKIEETLWVALRMMEEKRHLLYRIADRETAQGSGICRPIPPAGRGSGASYPAAERIPFLLSTHGQRLGLRY